ncbi:MAG TPA: SCO6880 family protein [Candidatus Angelobacter sp.]|nr:SCO6880 family protein [Candidatus Angelobacter sp.]
MERRGLFLGVRLGQLVVGLATTVIVVAVFSLWPSPSGAGAALVLIAGGAAVGCLPVLGRTPEQWAPVVAGYLHAGLVGDRRWLGPTQYRGHELATGRSGAPDAVRDPAAPQKRPAPTSARGPVADDGEQGDGAGEHRWVSAVRRVDAGDIHPPFLRGIELLAATWRQGDIGVVKDARRRTYVGVIAASGAGFALLDQGQKERLLAQWGAVLSGLAREAGMVTRVQWLERTAPDDSESVVRHLGEHQALPGSSPFVRSYLALLDEAGPQTQQHEVLIALQVSALRASPLIRQLRSGVDVGACEVLSRELDALATGLRRADVAVRGIFSPRMLAAAFRYAVDPPAREHLAHRTAANPDLAGASPRNAFPRRSLAMWSALQTEGAYHATYWVSEWPRAAVDTDWMAPLLLGTRCRRTVSVVMEPSPPAMALRRVEAARVDDATTQSLRERFGFRTTVRKRREEENVARAEIELNEGHSVCRLSAYITVSARTRRELDAACSDMEQRASQARLDVRREYGSQDVAFTYTLPLCRGLR